MSLLVRYSQQLELVDAVLGQVLEEASQDAIAASGLTSSDFAERHVDSLSNTEFLRLLSRAIGYS